MEEEKYGGESRIKEDQWGLVDVKIRESERE